MEKKRVQLVGLAAVVALLLGGVLFMTRSHRSGDSTTASQGGGSAGTPSNGSDTNGSQKSSGQPGSVTALNGAVAPGKSGTVPGASAVGTAGTSGVALSGSAAGAMGANGATVPGAPGVAGALPGAPSLPGLPGSATVANTAPGAAVPAAVPAATPVPDACYTITYHHKAVSGHTDEEACSHHKNLIQFKHENVNAKNVCVRVNGTPVHFLSVKGHADQVLIGAVAGPKAKLTVSYCVGSAKCEVKEDCTVPKDEFMEAIGGTTADVSKDARLGQWDPSMPSDKEADVLAKLDGDVKRELETNDDLNGRSRRGDMFKDWLSDNEGPACGVRQAKN